MGGASGVVLRWDRWGAERSGRVAEVRERRSAGSTSGRDAVVGGGAEFQQWEGGIIFWTTIVRTFGVDHFSKNTGGLREVGSGYCTVRDYVGGFDEWRRTS